MIKATLLALVSSSAIAWSDNKPALNPQASAHNEIALTAFSVKDYATAAREFEAAYDADAEPALLYGWAQSARLGGHCADAIPLYRKYLDANVSPQSLEAARTNIAQCEQTLAAQAPRRPPPPPAEPAQPQQAAWYADPVADALAIGGVAGIAVGITFVVKSHTSESSASHAATLPAFHTALDDATTQKRIGYTALAIGGALAGAGVFLWVRHAREHNTRVVTTDGRSVIFAASF
jgi:hypothetical protein